MTCRTLTMIERLRNIPSPLSMIPSMFISFRHLPYPCFLIQNGTESCLAA